MPIPMAVARFNRRFTNRMLWPIVRRSKFFALLVHRGRRSGRVYTTPVNVFDRDDGLVVALTYGPDVDWLKNVMAADGCDVERAGVRTRYVNLRLIAQDNARPAIPTAIRSILWLLGVEDYVQLDSSLR